MLSWRNLVKMLLKALKRRTKNKKTLFWKGSPSNKKKVMSRIKEIILKRYDILDAEFEANRASVEFLEDDLNSLDSS